MSNYTIHERPELISQQTLDNFVKDAHNWRTLLHALKDRGHNLTTLDQLIAHFPDFIGMANSTQQPTAAQTTPTPQDPPDPFLDAFLTPYSGKTSYKPHAPIRRILPVNIREFAEAETALGPVAVGYTENAQLAFTFQNTNDVYLVQLTDVLNEVMAHVVTHKPISAKPRKLNRLM
jgi:hypothetical protein